VFGTSLPAPGVDAGAICVGAVAGTVVAAVAGTVPAPACAVVGDATMTSVAVGRAVGSDVAVAAGGCAGCWVSVAVGTGAGFACILL
jgi:hypothetical protein